MRCGGTFFDSNAVATSLLQANDLGCREVLEEQSFPVPTTHKFVGGNEASYIENAKVPPAKHGHSSIPVDMFGSYHQIKPVLDTYYGYEDHKPDLKTQNGLKTLLSPRVQDRPLRSSMKVSGALKKRRAAMPFGEEFVVYLPGQEEPVRRRSSIQFDEKVRVRKVTATRHLSKRPEKLWFQEEDYSKMRGKAKAFMRKMESDCTISKDYHIRGLERLLDSQQVNRTKLDAWDAILGEQMIQREEGKFDEAFMATVYKDTTKQAREEATQRAFENQADIQGYMETTRKMFRRSSLF